MSRRDEWDDDYDNRGRRSSRRDDYDDYDRPRRSDSGTGSGLAVAMGVIHIIVGSLALLMGFCFLIGGVIVAGEGPRVREAGLATFVLIMMAIGGLLAGAGGITAGIGTLTRRFWGWVIGLIAASLSAVLAIIFFIGMIQAFSLPPFADRTGPILTSIIGVLLSLGYSVFIFIASFQSSVRSIMR